MKVKLLKKVRKRFEIFHLPNGFTDNDGPAKKGENQERANRNFPFRGGFVEGKLQRAGSEHGLKENDVHKYVCCYWGGSTVTRPVPSIPGDYRLYYAGVRDAILGKSPAPVTALDAWRVARLMEWAAASSEERREIPCDWSEEPK